MAQKKVKATLNGNNIDRRALSLLNAASDRQYELMKAVEARNTVKKEMREKDYTAKYIKIALAPYEKDIERQRNAMDNIVSSFYSLYMSEADLYTGKDCFTCDIEGVLQNIGVLEGCADDLKKSHVEKFNEMRNRFLNRAYWMVGDNSMDAVYKEIKNKPVEQLVSLRDSLYALGCFYWGERHELILKDFPKSEEQEQATA